jgi:hypothetical protein
VVWDRSSRRLQTNRNRKFGTVGDAVVQVLARASCELRMIEIHTAVEELLAGSISRSSVKNFLAKGCQRRTPVFERTGHGRYPD